MNAKKPESLDDATTTMRVSRNTLRRIKIIAVWKEMSLSQYVEYLVQTQGAKDLDDMKKEFLNSTYSLDLKTPLQ